MPRQSLIDYLREYSRHGRSLAFVQRSGYRTARTSYRETAELAAQCAREFERIGIAPGDRILLWGRNSAEWAAAFFGCLLRGAVAVPLDKGATADFVSRVAQRVDARLLLRDRENVLSGEQRPVIVFDSLQQEVARHSSEPYASPPLDRSSIAQIIFTSGATGEPKGVVISHGNILANLEPLEAGIRPYLKWERFVHPLRFLDLVPVSHVFGQFMGCGFRRCSEAASIFRIRSTRRKLFRRSGRSAFRSWSLCRACSKRCRARSSATSKRKGRWKRFGRILKLRRTNGSHGGCGASGKFTGALAGNSGPLFPAGRHSNLKRSGSGGAPDSLRFKAMD